MSLMKQNSRKAIRIGMTGARLGFGLAALLVACAKSPAPIVGPPDEGDLGMSRVCEFGDRCGDGCCGATERCIAEEGRCVTAEPCVTSNDCGGDSYCTGGGRCLPNADGRVNQSCRVPIDLAQLTPVVQCQWPGATPPSYRPEAVQVITTAMVMDLGLDDSPEVRPSIVFVSYEGGPTDNRGVLRVIDGTDCREQFSLDFGGDLPARVPPAIGDLDPRANDGPEIVVTDRQTSGNVTQNRIVAYKIGREGFTEMWNLVSFVSADVQGLAIADVHDEPTPDDDDTPEVLTETLMIDGRTGTAIVQIPACPVDEAQNATQRLAIRNCEGETRSLPKEAPLIADVNRDRVIDFITPNGIFAWDRVKRDWFPTVWRSQGNVVADFLGMANLGTFFSGLDQGADSLEIVLVGQSSQVWVKTVDSRNLLTINASDEGFAGGPPVIADFDGDGRMEFASAGPQALTVFDLDCQPGETFNRDNCSGEANPRAILWQAPTNSPQTGMSVFDFDGNGKAEVVHADQCFLRAFDGTTGNMLFQVPRSSSTQWEYPTIADSDNDGHTEIILGSNDNSNLLRCDQKSHGITVWRDPEDKWVSSRPLWNEHNYSITNVRDDGTIPSFDDMPEWYSPAAPNTFRQNSQGQLGSPLELPDITVQFGRYQCAQNRDQLTLAVSLCNRGTQVIGAGVTGLAVTPPPGRGISNCSATNRAAINPGDCEQVDCTLDFPRGGTGVELTVTGDSQGGLSECLEGNNEARLADVYCAGSGPT